MPYAYTERRERQDWRFTMKRQPIQLEPLPQAKVEIINLIDVLITLVAFFMLTTVFAQERQELGIELPQAKQTQTVKPELPKIIIELDKENKWFVKGRPVSERELFAILKRQPAQTAVLIRADRSSRYGRMIRLMDLLKQTGLTRVGFEVKRP
jgi:biopolymer transport protein ExbD